MSSMPAEIAQLATDGIDLTATLTSLNATLHLDVGGTLSTTVANPPPKTLVFSSKNWRLPGYQERDVIEDAAIHYLEVV